MERRSLHGFSKRLYSSPVPTPLPPSHVPSCPRCHQCPVFTRALIAPLLSGTAPSSTVFFSPNLVTHDMAGVSQCPTYKAARDKQDKCPLLLKYCMYSVSPIIWTNFRSVDDVVNITWTVFTPNVLFLQPSLDREGLRTQFYKSASKKTETRDH